MAASARGWRLGAQVRRERIQTEAVEAAEAVTSTSVRCPTARVTVVVVYGRIGVKSLAMTVMVWLSIENCWMPSAPELMRRSRCVLPCWNLNLASPALGVQGVASPAATEEQSKLFLPLMRLLSEVTRGLPCGASISVTMS